jgi:hypothetical protein
MIKLFRHIRQRYISEGKTKKYLLYAIGEIILVVIGILIALQINTWNENRKDKIKEQVYLKNLINELTEDIDSNKQYVLDRYSKKVEVLKKGKAYYQGKYVVVDTISFLNDVGYGNVFGNVTWAFNETTYNQLVNTGDFKVIKNDSLKTLILNYYNTVKSMEESGPRKTTGYIKFTNSLAPFNRSKPGYISDFDTKFFISKLNSEEFYRLVNLELTLAYQIKDYAERMSADANELIKLIETHLND